MEGEPRIALIARLRTRDGVEISHRCSFTPDDWRTLEKFADYAADLSRTALVSTGSGLSFSLTSDDDGVRFESKAMPDSDQVSALLHRMRPFILKKEPRTSREFETSWRDNLTIQRSNLT